MTDSPVRLRIVAALLVDVDGRALLVRKRGTRRFMQPGGKPEAGESAEDALVRELKEELGLQVAPGDLRRVGRFSALAANEADTVVDAEIFDAPVVTTAVAVAAEIEELLWIDPADPGGIDLAPLSRDILLPLLAARRP
ncbi:MAG TPA: NUDIX domain-containing protein [Lacisediminihabitans sp.]|uniref:NUDIX hydrolase n=1 Tax=Lacisediminihabitans sp. TaxID=2787631 RepID=UPI002EDA6EF7